MNGLVSLIGAGPGNPELLTLLGKRRLEEADVIVYDRLVNPAMLSPFVAEKKSTSVSCRCITRSVSIRSTICWLTCPNRANGLFG